MGFWGWIIVIAIALFVIDRFIRSAQKESSNFMRNLPNDSELARLKIERREKRKKENLIGSIALIGLVVLIIVIIYHCSQEPSVKKVRVGNIPEETSVVDEAYRFCGAMRDTGLVISCDIDVIWGGKNNIDVVIDTNSREARQMCADVQYLVPSAKSKFDGDWQMRIISPYSGGTPIATCTLY